MSNQTENKTDDCPLPYCEVPFSEHDSVARITHAERAKVNARKRGQN